MLRNILCLIGMVALSQALIFPSEAIEKSDRFLCETNSKGENDIRMILSDGKTPKDLTGLRSEHFSVSGFTPKVRCVTIADRLNIFAREARKQQGKNFKLGFKTGRSNGYNVICAVKSFDSKCGPTIVTLTPSDRKPDEALDEFINSFGTFTSGRKFLEGTPGIGKLFFPIELILAQ